MVKANNKATNSVAFTELTETTHEQLLHHQLPYGQQRYIDVEVGCAHPFMTQLQVAELQHRIVEVVELIIVNESSFDFSYARPI